MTNQEYFDSQCFRYKYENLNPGLKRTMDCIVRAIMRVTGQVTVDDWKRIYTDLFTRGLKDYVTHHEPSVYYGYLEELGFEMHTVKDAFNENNTLEKFCNQNTKGIYVLGIESHAIAYINGVLYDNNRSMIRDIRGKNWSDTCFAKRYFNKNHVLWYGVKVI